MRNIQFIVEEKNIGKKLNVFIRDNFSKRISFHIKRNGSVKVNDIKPFFSYELKLGDVISIEFPNKKSEQTIKPIYYPLNIVFENDDYMIINKDAKITTIPSKMHGDVSLANAIKFYYDNTNQKDATIHFVNRLDMNTSGLIILAKNSFSHSKFYNVLNSKKIKKLYTTVVVGKMNEPSGSIEEPIARDGSDSIKRIVSADGKYALTKYNVKELNDNYTIVEVELVTGRTHQIRVHFSHIGYPLVGDHLYNDNATFDRQLLHASKLIFNDPFTNEERVFEAELPVDFINYLEEFKKRA